MQFSAFLSCHAFTDLVKKLLSYNQWVPNGDRIAFSLPGKPLLAFITVHNCRACQRALSIPVLWADQGCVCCANNNPAAALQTPGAKWDNGLCQAFEFIPPAWCLQCSMTSCLSLHTRFPCELDALWGLLLSALDGACPWKGWHELLKMNYSDSFTNIFEPKLKMHLLVMGSDEAVTRAEGFPHDTAQPVAPCCSAAQQEEQEQQGRECSPRSRGLLLPQAIAQREHHLNQNVTHSDLGSALFQEQDWSGVVDTGSCHLCHP